MWLVVVAALLAVRFSPPDLSVAKPHQAVVKQSAARDKRPYVQRLDVEGNVRNSDGPGWPLIAALQPFYSDPGLPAHQSNTSLYNRPPPLLDAA